MVSLDPDVYSLFAAGAGEWQKIQLPAIFQFTMSPYILHVASCHLVCGLRACGRPVVCFFPEVNGY